MNFDWVSFGFQLVNVLVLLAILRHFLFRPVTEAIARRQAQTDAALQAAADAKADADKAEAKAKAEAEASAVARQDVLAKAHKDGEAQRQALLDAARKEAAKLLADGRAVMQQDRAGADAIALGRARDLAVTIARYAFAAQPTDWNGYVERIVSALNVMAPAEREALLRGANLRLVAPVPLSVEKLGKVQAALAAFGIEPKVEVDGDLVAGLELRSDSGLIGNSLAHDLDRIAEAMRDGDPS